MIIAKNRGDTPRRNEKQISGYELIFQSWIPNNLQNRTGPWHIPPIEQVGDS